MIKLLVGLGNPGAEYEDNRHNVGFWLVEKLAAQWRTSLKLESKFLGVLGKPTDVGLPLLLMPQTYMNRSGQSVAALAKFYKIDVSEILVVHDELDLLPGVVRLKKGGGVAGHNGLKDIQSHLGADFWRLRLGIGHPGHRDKVASFVLHRPTKDEQVAIEESIEKSLVHLPLLFKGDHAKATLLLHTKD